MATHLRLYSLDVQEKLTLFYFETLLILEVFHTNPVPIQVSRGTDRRQCFSWKQRLEKNKSVEECCTECVMLLFCNVVGKSISCNDVNQSVTVTGVSGLTVHIIKSELWSLCGAFTGSGQGSTSDL